MGNARARAHHLNVAGLCAALVAKAVLMGDGAFAHEGDDLDVPVRVQGKTGMGAMLSSFHTLSTPMGACSGLPTPAKAKWWRATSQP
jgi:hypothetical protein